jgi:hypothetical protein
MLSPDEIHLLESLLKRARHAAAAPNNDAIAPGDVVQLRPGADPHWETSLLLVCRVRPDGAISGQILRPHRGGHALAWYTYRPPAVVKVGNAPFPEPAMRVRSWSYDGPSESLHNSERKQAGRETRTAVRKAAK